jgi:DNA-binding MarR family transcriptional regulator
MTRSNEFTLVLRDWTETFMRRSMHDFIRFSKDSGLSMAQMSALFHLHHGSRCGVSGIGDLLGVTNAAASQMIDRLVQHGLIERTEDPVDRRAKQLRLTERGRFIVRESIEVRRRWMERLIDALTGEEQSSIINALTILTNAARNLEPGKNQIENIRQTNILEEKTPAPD